MPDGDLSLWPLWPALTRDMLLRPALPNAPSSPHYISVGQLADFINAGGIAFPIAIAQGGTGSVDAASARANLGAAPLDSPVFTGTPQAPTQLAGDNSQRLATTAFVMAALAANAGSRVTIAASAPSSPAAGDLWWSSADGDGNLYVYFNDGTSAQWVVSVSQPGPAGPQGPAGATGPTGPAGSANMSGMTAGQIPIAASATSVTSSGNLSGDVTTAGSLVTTLATVPIAKGGTGQTSATSGFNALAAAGGTVGGNLTVTPTGANGVQLNGLAGFNQFYRSSVAGTRDFYFGTSSSGPYEIFDATAATTRLRIDNAGACFNTGGTWTNISEPDLKQDIRPWRRGRGLAAVRRLNPVRFRYRAGTPFASKDKASDRLIGLLADEVEAVLPDLVGRTTVTVDGEEREVRTIQPGWLVYALLNALQELADEVDRLKEGRG